MVLVLASQELCAKSFEMLRLQRRFDGASQHLANGFAEIVRGEEWNYDNLWNNKTAAMITRATNGTMVMEWMSEPAKAPVDGYAGFLFLVCVDQTNSPEEFDLSVDGKPAGAIRNLPGRSWSQQLQSGVRVEFVRYAQNSWNDAMGFMTLFVPKSMVTTGKPLRFTLVGPKRNVNTWLMIFKNKELAEEIAMKHKYDRFYDVSVHDKWVEIVTLAGRGARFGGRWSSGRSIVPTLRHGADSLVMRFDKRPGEGFELTCDGRTVFSVADIDRVSACNRLDGTTLTRLTVSDAGTRFSVSQERSDAVMRMRQLDSSCYRGADVHIMVSSHQDIAWVDSPYQCIEDRDKRIVTPALELMQKYDDYRYDIEDALILEEYVERHPDKFGLLSRLIRSGQLGIGASYTQPYEEIQSGEALVRQFYFGKRWVDKTFGGAGQRTYWNMDVPARTPQMPQILKKCGVDYLMYSRHKAGVYRWVAPDDSSSVVTFTPGHYTAAAQFLRNAPELEIERMTAYMKQYPDSRKDPKTVPVVGMLSAEDMSEAHTYYNWADAMDRFSKQYRVSMPTMQHSTADRFMDALVAAGDSFPQIKGERPDLWQYIHSASHADAFASYRRAVRLSPEAETFSTVSALLSGGFGHYPTRELNEMWRAVIYPDHGWGGNKGYITDSLFEAKYNFAEAEASKLLRRALRDVAAYVKTDGATGRPILVFNGASWERSDYCEAEVPAASIGEGAVLKDCAGKPVAYQVVSSDEKTGRVKIGFVAPDVPSVGYTTLFLQPGRKTKQRVGPQPVCETPYYRLDWVDGELCGIYDKELGRQLFDISKFAIADVICMQSVGNGAGEFATMQLPSTDHYEQASKIENRWTMLSDGAVYSLFSTKARFRNAEVVRYMKVYKGIKRIDFSTDVVGFDGEHYLEYRQVFPMCGAMEVTYEVPFGAVTVGRDEMQGVPGERYLDPAGALHPRTSSGWIAASDDDMTLALTSDAALVDYIDPTDLQNPNTVLQSVLFCSRKSCHPLGGFYEQKGDHHFEFSVTSQGGRWHDCVKRAMSADRPLTALDNPRRYADASLPLQASFFGVEGGNAVVTAVKRAEDDDDVVMRLYDLSGSESRIVLRSLFDLETIRRTDMIENNAGRAGTASQQLGRNAIETFKIKIRDAK